MVRRGVTRAFGYKLRSLISHSVKNRVRAFFAGMGVTMFLQSSTATTLIVTNFVGKGLVPVSAAVAIVLGADVGSTIIVQILSYDFSWLAPLFILIGYVLFNKYENGGVGKYIGRTFMGLGMMLLALGWISDASGPIKESEMVSDIFTSLRDDSFFVIVLSAVLTWLCHSSLASVLLVVSFVGTGVVPFDLGVLMVLGANVGHIMAPLLAGYREGPLATQIPMANLIMKVTGVFLVYPFLDLIMGQVLLLDDSHMRAVVNFHLVFNLFVALLFLPFTPLVAKLVGNMFPDKINRDDPSQALYLDDSALDTPPVALASASRETLRMGDLTERMLRDWMEGFKRDNEKCLERISALDDIVDDLYTQIKHYVARVSTGDMDEKEAHKQVQIITFATNLEHIGDIIDGSLVSLAKKKVIGNKRLSTDGFAEISEMFLMVVENTRLAQNVFLSEDVRLAKKLVDAKETFKLMEQAAAKKHMSRLRDGVPETLQTSSIHMDIVRDLKRINDYVVSVAYSVIEGDLRPISEEAFVDLEGE